MDLKSTDLGSTSSVLKRLPPVPGSFQNDAFLVWNSVFQQSVGLSGDEQARIPLTSLLIPEGKEGDAIVEDHDAECDIQRVPCVLKNPIANVHGRAVACDDGMSLAIPNATLAELVLKGFDQGWRMGCEEERNRTRHFFHDVLSSKILVASFFAHEIHQKLAASGAEEAEDMARLTKLLQEAIEAIVHGAEEY
jgi:hypothetical protein